MTNFDEIISALPRLSAEQRAKIFQSLLLLTQSTESTESHDDLVPIDVPIESKRIVETGELQIRFAYQSGWRSKELSWRTMKITPDAQLALLQLLKESVDLDDTSYKSQSKSTKTQ